MADYDVIILGAGPGGYVCALRAAQLGFSVACVEKDKSLGGTCLNIGCIPSKALLDSSEHYAQAKHGLAKHGVKVSGVDLDLPTMMKRKDQVVSQLTRGVAGLFKKNKVEHVLGFGRFVAKDTIEVKGLDGNTRKITGKHIIIATGSDSAPLPTAPYDGKRIVSSTEALSLPEVPGKLLVVGAGAIGLEMGSVWLRLGAEVTVVEFQDRIAPMADRETGKELMKTLVKQGMQFKLATKVTSAKVSGKSVQVEMEDAAGKKTEMEVDYVLVAIGRRPFTEGLGLEEVGIKKDHRGRIEINEKFETSVPGVYAIGDVVQGPMLAHKAEDEGMALAEQLTGQHSHVYYDAIPSVIYTWPELASTGWSEEECKSRGIAYNVGKFPFMANGRAKAMDEVEGFVKILADAKTDRVLGVWIVGPRASDMIAEAVAVVEFGGSAEDIARSSHAHPTLAEVMKEAALAVDKRAIHF